MNRKQWQFMRALKKLLATRTGALKDQVDKHVRELAAKVPKSKGTIVAVTTEAAASLKLLEQIQGYITKVWPWEWKLVVANLLAAKRRIDNSEQSATPTFDAIVVAAADTALTAADLIWDDLSQLPVAA